MKELILTKHSRKNSPPETQECNNKQEPIDGIFTTPGITGIKSDYLGLRESGNYDHKASWVDVSYKEALGFTTIEKTPTSMRRLSTKLPSRVIKYNALVKEKNGKQRIIPKNEQFKTRNDKPYMEKNEKKVQRHQETTNHDQESGRKTH